MKKVFTFILLGIVIPVYADIKSDLTGAAGKYAEGLLGESIGKLMQLNQGLNEATSMCYVPKKGGVASMDICGYINSVDKLSVDICSLAPDVPGFTKKKNVLSADNYLKNLCKDTEALAKSTIADMGNIVNENNFDFKSDTNSESNDDKEKKAGEFFAQGNGGSTKEIVKNPESVSRQALYSGNQKVMREVANYAKNTSGKMSDVKIKDLSAPSNYTSYLLDRKALVKASFMDYQDKSPITVASEIRKQVSDINDSVKALAESDKLSANATASVEFGTNQRIALYIDALARDDDYAIPTQEMVNLLREDLRPEAIAKIKNQMKREALIISELKQIDQARKDILTIAGNKATVITRQFDAAKAKEEIDAIIEK